ncbi:ATP phosphoribosyltransferase regulatory subunit [Metabacillus sp. GX 13764]|uniref:ATP phosphoribosyltransferase regulatory subunit n=1 Tax=Metabacillus kandeliae TaxID=2900151 RepID=UPI001E342867|nr:ATP phosphoribosyltransferase regulatory subunit [Metabacillus kandeliae]MCD7035884.1 ATP phosphoribosyltransferase regulatory subunit [Metabacillus kandeliae]
MYMFEKPLGMRDTMPSVYKSKKKLRESLQKEISQWGFDFIETPTLEFYETVGVQSAILDQQLFKLLDRQGHTLVLRPDMTAPIARIAASKLYKNQNPLRIAYLANVFRAQQHEGGRPAEFEQMGTELIGDGSTYADAEMIALLVSVLQAAGLKDFSIAIGHIGFADALFKEILGNQERADRLRRYLYEKNYVGYREHVKELPLSSIDKQRLLAFLVLRGGIEKADEALAISEMPEGRAAIAEIKELWSALLDYGVTEYIKLDLNIVSHMSYYTGVLFEVYASQIGFPLGNGGRYDQLLGKFDAPAPATGFGIHLDRLLEALGESEEPVSKHCIIYSSERAKEAIEYAAALRRDGLETVLQHIKGIQNLDDFTKSFKDVSYFIGTRKEGSL